MTDHPNDVLETTRRYSLPSDADRQAAMDALTIDY